MAHSEEDNDKDLAEFLFGDIDDNGQLEYGILDPEANQRLVTFSRLGINLFLCGKMPYEINNEEEDTGYFAMPPTALDFSDINELADDLNDDKDSIYDRKSDYDENVDYDADDEEVVSKSDTQLMRLMPEVKEVLTAEEVEAVRQRKLEIPLASINVEKPSRLLQIRQSVRKQRKKKGYDIRDSNSGSDQDGWIIQSGPNPGDGLNHCLIVTDKPEEQKITVSNEESSDGGVSMIPQLLCKVFGRNGDDQSQKNKINIGKGNRQQQIEKTFDDLWAVNSPANTEELARALIIGELLCHAKYMEKIPKSERFLYDDENSVGEDICPYFSLEEAFAAAGFFSVFPMDDFDM